MLRDFQFVSLLLLIGFQLIALILVVGFQFFALILLGQFEFIPLILEFCLDLIATVFPGRGCRNGIGAADRVGGFA